MNSDKFYHCNTLSESFPLIFGEYSMSGGVISAHIIAGVEALASLASSLLATVLQAVMATLLSMRTAGQSEHSLKCKVGFL